VHGRVAPLFLHENDVNIYLDCFRLQNNCNKMTLLDDDSVSGAGASKVTESSKCDGVKFNQA
jgi:hypothetical protein